MNIAGWKSAIPRQCRPIRWRVPVRGSRSQPRVDLLSRLIAAALIVAVAAVAAVTLFTDRVRQAMVLRANTLARGAIHPATPRL
jgi:predicted lysophospholipase L1 biosynthesis ABC-type transport system permease subunit